MMIQRATDATFINAVVNHPAVRPFVYAPDGPLDLTAVVKNPNHLVLTGQYGGMVMVQSLPSVYELHTNVLPEGRGKWAYDMAQECVDYLFSRTNAIEIFTRVPVNNAPARALAINCGAKPEHRLRQKLSGEWVDLDIYGGRIQDWIRIAPGLVARGQEFHRRLHEKCAAAGIKVDHHDPDEWHDRHVGAAAGMVIGGQPIKGTLVYNRWAAMAMAPMMKMLSVNPVVFDLVQCRIEICGDDFEVHACQ